jgi:hypothetical protein
LESNSLSKEAKLPLNHGQLTKQKLGKERARKNSKTNRKEEQQHNPKTRQAQNSKESSQHATQYIDHIN